MLTVTDATWSRVTESDIPVIVMFGASWCRPCQTAVPLLDAYATSRSGSVRVYKADIKEAENAALAVNVLSVPTFVLYKKGIPVQKHTSLDSRLASTLDAMLAG